MKIIALDPGGTTGIAMTMLNTNTTKCGIIITQQLSGEHHSELYKFLVKESPNVIIYERFLFQNRKQKVVLDSCEHIGIAKLYSQLTGKALAPQTAASAKNVWTDDKLKRLCLWEKGKPHAMDAVRHLLYFVTSELGINQYINQLRRAS